MSTQTQYVAVESAEALGRSIDHYVVQGYAVQQRTATGATLLKPKQLNVPIVVVSALLCIIPLVVYLIVFANQSDQVVVISVGPAGPGPGAAPPSGARPLAAFDAPPVGVAPSDAPPSGVALRSGSFGSPAAGGPGSSGPDGFATPGAVASSPAAKRSDRSGWVSGTPEAPRVRNPFSVRQESDRIASEAQAAADERRAAARRAEAEAEAAATARAEGRQPEGLYPDPANPARLRWWDGERWADEG